MAVSEELHHEPTEDKWLTMLAGFRSRLHEIQRSRDTCDICDAYKEPCNEVIHVAYEEMRQEEIDDELEAIAAAKLRGEPAITFVTLDEMSKETERLARQIEHDNHNMPIGKLLAETLDFIGEGCITYTMKRKVSVNGNVRRKSVIFVCCAVCTAEITLEERDNGVELQHDGYCIVPQTNVLIKRLLALQ